MSKLPLWLCVGDKKTEKCVYARVEIIEEDRPISAMSSFTVKTQVLTVFCEKKLRPVLKYTTKCPYYVNTTLEDYR